jgi:hypothetical protein
MDLVEQSLIAAGLDADGIKKISNEVDAINHALSIARKDDLVCIMSGRVEQVIQHLYTIKEKAELAEAVR